MPKSLKGTKTEKNLLISFAGESQVTYSWQSLDYESDEIENALKFLSVAPFSILKKQNDEYSLTGDIDSILKKVGLLFQAFNSSLGLQIPAKCYLPLRA